MKKIAIITLFYHNYNYGGVLQAYALQKEIEKLGYNCDVISMDRQTMKIFVPEAKNKNNSYKNNFITFLTSLKNRIKNKLNSLLCINELQKKIKKFDSFIEKNIRKTDIVYTSDTISQLIDKYDLFITGSDQVFSPVSGRAETFLSFVPDEKGKISYAASIGADSITDEYGRFMKSFLKRFDVVSVREKGAKTIIDNLMGKDICKVVLDPTLLYQESWTNLAFPVNGITAESYVLLYFLGESDNEWNRAYSYAKTMGLKILNIPYNKMQYNKRDYRHKQNFVWGGGGPEEFLWLIQNAAIVLTDSFHGTVFSVLFHKKFLVYLRESENENGSMNGRMKDFLSSLSLEDRMINQNNKKSQSETADKQIDFETIDKKLDILRADSIKFLERALYEY